MAQDPYGFEEPAAPSAADPEGDATASMWLGLTSAVLASVGICFCYIPYCFAFPIGAYAVWRGSRALSAADARDRTMAAAGMVSGGVSSAIGGMFTFFWLMYLGFLALYFVIVFVAIAVGAIAEPPS